MRHLPKNSPRVAILVDNPYRDLPGLVLVARHLALRGAVAYLVPMNLREQEIWPLMPDMVVLNHFRTIYEPLVRRLMSAGILVSVLDTEGTIYSPKAKPLASSGLEVGDEWSADDSDLDEYACSMARDESLRRQIACYCAWTPRFARYAAHKGWYKADQLHVTGHPRMDLYAEPWTCFARAISPYAEPFSRNLVMINGSFALANPRFQTPEAECRMLSERFSYDPCYVQEWLGAQQAALKGMIDMSRSMALRFPDVTFVYRPHPFEDERTYTTEFGDIRNLSLIKEGTVDGWLLRARSMIHWGSSTAIDACLAGIPAFSPGWLPTFPPIPSVQAVSVQCETKDTLSANLARVLEGSYELPVSVREAVGEVIENTFYRIDGRAHERVADALLDAVTDHQPQPSLSRCWELAPKPLTNSLRARVTRRLKRKLGLPSNWSFRHLRRVRWLLDWDQSPKAFDTRQVRDLIRAADAAEREGGKCGNGTLIVRDADDKNDYRLPYIHGRTVVVEPG